MIIGDHVPRDLFPGDVGHQPPEVRPPQHDLDVVRRKPLSLVARRRVAPPVAPPEVGTEHTCNTGRNCRMVYPSHDRSPSPRRRTHRHPPPKYRDSSPTSFWVMRTTTSAIAMLIVPATAAVGSKENRR